MNSTQIACLQKLINALQECEGNGLTFSYASLLINVEDEESHYLEYLSAQKLFELLDFIDGCGDVKYDDPSPEELNNLQTPEVYIGYDDGSRVGDHSCRVEIKDGVVQSWEIIK